MNERVKRGTTPNTRASRSVALIAGIGIALAGAMVTTSADDTEIFFSAGDGSVDSNPNVLFVLDNSGSMSLTDANQTGSRMDRLKAAMRLLLDQSSTYNVGLAAFGGAAGGASIRYPVGWLEGTNENVCGDGPCPDETVVSRVTSINGDATQNNDSNDVDLNSATLTMATVPEPVDTSAQEVSVTKSVLATSDAFEAFPEPTAALPESSIDNVATDWFWSGTEGADPGRVAIRFDNVELPPKAEVQSAHITFTRTDLADQKGTMDVRISAEGTSNPLPYTPPPTLAEYEQAEEGSGQHDWVPLLERSSAENATLATVSWEDVPPFTGSSDSATLDDESDPVMDTSDLSPILTEVAALNEWESGKAVSFIFRPGDQYVVEEELRRFHGVSAAETVRPVLHFTYVTRENATTTDTRVFSANVHTDVFREASTDVAWTNGSLDEARLFHVDNGYSPRKLGLRFDEIDIPRDAEITSARLILSSTPQEVIPDTDDWTRDPEAAVDTSEEPEVAVEDPPQTEDDPDIGDANPVVSMTIAAETTGTPEPYGYDGLAGRELTTNLQTWTDIPDDRGVELQSPDLSQVISEVISLEDWNAGDNLSLVLSPGADYESSDINSRSIFTPLASNKTVKPALDVTWVRPDAVTEVESQSQTTALRFERVYVPPVANIVSARIVFTAAEPSDGETNLTVSAEQSGASAALASTDNNIGERLQTSARQIWEPEPWELSGQEYSTVDLSDIVSEVIGLSDWCGGNAMTFFLDGVGDRVAQAYRDVASAAPRLEISYSPASVATDGYCSNSAIDRSLADGADDAVQSLTGSQSIGGVNVGTNSELDGSGDDQYIGLHFNEISVPTGTRIVSATLRLNSRVDITDSSTLAINIEDIGNSANFRILDLLSTARNWSTTTVDWQIDGPLDAGEPTLSSDIGALLQSIVDRPDWDEGNGMTFRLERKNGAHRHFISQDSDDILSADLVIYYESERLDAASSFREALKQQVEALTDVQPATPIVSSLQEAALYMTGNPMKYGYKRGLQNNYSRYLRVSHPASYSGGTVYRPEGCNDLTLGSVDCATEEIQGSPVYTSPIESQCQSNHIVLLSDGAPFDDPIDQGAIESMIGTSCDTTSWGNWQQCGRELSDWLQTTDHSPDLPGRQSIEVHTIALALDPQYAAFLEALSTDNGGHYAADSAADLLNAFKSIFANVSDTDATFVSPSVTVSSANRLKNRDDVYFSLFKPEPTDNWSGNLKRYRSSATDGSLASLVDANGNPAVDPNTGEFKKNARSFWSATADGGSVAKGGAAAQLDSNMTPNSDRKVYTFTGGEASGGSQKLSHSSNMFDKSNPRIDASLFDIPPPLDTDEDYFGKLFDWSRGMDVKDHDGDDNTTETRAQLGDPLHSQPVLLNYANGKSIVFVATNEGFLHAFDSDTGEELWAWIPQELYKNLHDRFQASSTRSRSYGLDGGITTWVDDTDRDGRIDNDERAILYIGMRRGGNSYYALDVSDIDDPEFMWRIAGGSKTVDNDDSTADGQFTELGQTWSLPQRTKVIDGNGTKDRNIIDVLVFGGGYSTNQDKSADDDPANELRSVDGVGRALFVVDALTGDELWRADHDSHTEMLYSIPSAPAVLDVDFDGIADQIYFGDMGGQVWRFDFNNDRSAKLKLKKRITGDRFAVLAGDGPGETRRFYDPPSVSLINAGGRQQLAVSIGSGWRAHPLDTAVQDRFFSIRTPYVYGPPVDSSGIIDYSTVYDDSGFQTPGFKDVTTATYPLDESEVSRGWYINIGQGVDGADDSPGEKSLSRPLTVDGKIIYTTYRPESQAGVCSAAIGSSVANVVNVVNGAPTDTFRNDGTAATLGDRHYELNQAGLAPGASIMFHENSSTATINIGTETLPIDVGELRRRTFWQEIVEGDTD